MCPGYSRLILQTKVVPVFASKIQEPAGPEIQTFCNSAGEQEPNYSARQPVHILPQLQQSE